MTSHATAEKQPQPVLSRASVITALTVLSALLVHVGGGNVSTWLDQNSDSVAAAILAVGPLATAFLARRHVTPKVSPKNDAGQDLVPAGSAAATVDAAAVLAAAEQIAPTPTEGV